MKICIVSAAYNERDNIKELITILEEEVSPEIKEHEMHILIADDNSPDGTGDVVRELMGKYKNLDINQGEDLALATMDVLINVDNLTDGMEIVNIAIRVACEHNTYCGLPCYVFEVK